VSSRYAYTAVSLKDDGPARKHARWAVADPNGKTVAVYAGPYAAADARREIRRLLEQVGRPASKV
jgi:hypothetical protein